MSQERGGEYAYDVSGNYQHYIISPNHTVKQNNITVNANVIVHYTTASIAIRAKRIDYRRYHIGS